MHLCEVTGTKENIHKSTSPLFPSVESSFIPKFLLNFRDKFH